jgi:hypothetical protein
MFRKRDCVFWAHWQFAGSVAKNYGGNGNICFTHQSVNGTQISTTSLVGCEWNSNINNEFTGLWMELKYQQVYWAANGTQISTSFLSCELNWYKVLLIHKHNLKMWHVAILSLFQSKNPKPFSLDIYVILDVWYNSVFLFVLFSVVCLNKYYTTLEFFLGHNT